ncbi:methyltransferase domain-containing protein [Streptosporangium carneum]|nr:methyltransferase domain-containing protein [Streptosporangium carneum]
MRAYGEVPRALFLPEVMWPFDDGRDLVISRTDTPEEWRRWADADVPITTQWDDGDHTGTAVGELRTSSGSMPSLVFAMFADLSVSDGMRVLEIGTGTGWCAALLSARLGERNVVSVELDAAVAARARKALDAAGWRPEVVTGDGLLGWPERAPYDRILVTVSVREVPRAWIDQAKPGAVIVMPWGTRYSHQDAIVRLVVADDGTASGRFTRLARFMQIRSQRLEVRHGDYIDGDDWPDDTRRSVPTLSASSLMPPGVEFALGLLVPDCTHVSGHDTDGTPGVWLYGLTDRSWAAVFFYGEDGHSASQVYQGGPRSLWDEVEAAYLWWVDQGRPGHGEFGLTVTADGQQAWLREKRQSVEAVWKKP